MLHKEMRRVQLELTIPSYGLHVQLDHQAFQLNVLITERLHAVHMHLFMHHIYFFATVLQQPALRSHTPSFQPNRFTVVLGGKENAVHLHKNNHGLRTSLTT